ncbi:glycosyltransferase family 2 protein [Aquimarina aquimarini]|uniref:glycosyltransferase family 2 protein n=1 Tax=Aquimarina aquimarini TaxID=1191734 RepID=UPI000D55840A|nr:glycosyltransferase family 2 protein [Aquimarina aquimarini]
MKQQKISIVISLYNEMDGIHHFWTSLKEVISEEKQVCFELIWVNDGSIDRTQEAIDEICEEPSVDNIKNIGIEFSKNFGHESAMIAGIDTASGEAVICIDSDGQHPPEEVPKMIKIFNEGNDIVLMKRLIREDSSYLKKQFSRFFYRVINLLSTIKFEENSTDFFLISKRIKRILKSNFRDQNRFIRGFIQSLGFSKKTLLFSAPARQYGESSYSYLGLLKLAFNAIFSFSNKPLRVSIVLSVIFTLFTLGMIGYTLYVYMVGNEAPSGYNTIMIFMSASFSILFITLSILSLYFEKIIQEIRKRPIYIIKQKNE